MLAHDKEVFGTPEGWRMKDTMEAPLIVSLPVLWESLSTTYQTELAQVAVTKLPNEKEIGESFEKIISKTLN